MKNHRELTLSIRDLPLTVKLLGDKGEEAIYQLAPAGRKFGASLRGIDETLRQQLLNINGNKT